MISSQPITQQPETANAERSKGLASSSRDTTGSGMGGMTSEGIGLMRQAHTTRSDTFIHFRDLLPCTGTCCIISSCFYKYPEVLGCTSKTTVCCTKTESVCCRVPNNDEDTLCICNSSRCDLISPRLVCQTQSQAWCIDTRCSLPPDDEEYPCLISICFLTCYFKDRMAIQFCKTGAQLQSQT